MRGPGTFPAPFLFTRAAGKLARDRGYLARPDAGERPAAATQCALLDISARR